MTIQTHFITEPLLEFGSGQKLEHPQDGLFLYGPVGVPGTPQSLHVGVVGTPDGIALVQKWLTTLVGRIAVNRTDQLHTSAWPGFQAAFGVKLVSNPLVEIALDGAEIFNAIRKNNRYDAVRSAVKIFEEAILNHFRVDERRPDVSGSCTPIWASEGCRPERNNRIDDHFREGRSRNSSRWWFFVFGYDE